MSLIQVFATPVNGHHYFEAVIRDNLDLVGLIASACCSPERSLTADRIQADQAQVIQHRRARSLGLRVGPFQISGAFSVQEPNYSRRIVRPLTGANSSADGKKRGHLSPSADHA